MWGCRFFLFNSLTTDVEAQAGSLAALTVGTKPCGWVIWTEGRTARWRRCSLKLAVTIPFVYLYIDSESTSRAWHYACCGRNVLMIMFIIRIMLIIITILGILLGILCMWFFLHLDMLIMVLIMFTICTILTTKPYGFIVCCIILTGTSGICCWFCYILTISHMNSYGLLHHSDNNNILIYMFASCWQKPYEFIWCFA